MNDSRWLNMSTTVNLTPVFITPKLEHSLLNTNNRYIALIILELIVVFLLIFVFFGEECRWLLTKYEPSINPLIKYKDNYLTCFKNKLYVVDNGAYVPALSLNGKHIVTNNCENILHNLNESQPVRVFDVFSRR
ncbi:Entry/fusion IMV membrane protein [Sea otter poxvirus]|uniref:Entry/fusion IMV membrane protein n=1 Tax=Sea otter poxvirus TaxID=1416741 RepID=A0A2U9QHN3_9POXV|nr:Entry/fusion IMV membrane protein [Sea otter poxvirus]AWU47109.1 Entry/fusion IMV membrane protein [Sea otter poxvirus]